MTGIVDQVVVSLFMGPGRDRWTPQSWDDVVTAAAGGLLDERHHIELKKALRPPDKDGNRELAKDLAALACDGGVMVIGVEDKGGGQAGDVVGTSLLGLAERINQVAGGTQVSPPVAVRTEPMPHPTTPDRGCMLVIVDPSIDGPHMVGQRYLGRNDTGTRVLSDLEVRRYLASNAQRREDFASYFAQVRAESPLGGPGVMHLLFRPHAPRRGALGQRLERAVTLLHQVTQDLPGAAPLWALEGELTKVRRVVRGVQYTDFSPSVAAEFRLADRASDVDVFTALRIWDDSTMLMSCSRMVYRWPNAPEGANKAVTVAGTMYRAEQAAVIAGRLGDLAGYGGQWDIGMQLGGLLGCHAGIEGHGRLVGHVEAAFPVDVHEELAATSSSELVSSPYIVVRRLLHEVFRVLGAEDRIETLRPLGSADQVGE
jgi:hypothetical protein